MRGSPLLQLLLVGCLFAAAGFPVWRLTHAARADIRPAPVVNAAPALADSPEPGGDRVHQVTLTFSSPPADFRLSYLGKTLLEGRGPQTGFAADIDVAIPKDGADFAVEAHWPAAEAGNVDAEKQAAVRVAFALQARTFEQTVWCHVNAPTVELITVTP